MGYSDDDAVHIIPHKNEITLAESAEKFGIDYFKLLHRIRYKEIDAVHVQYPLK